MIKARAKLVLVIGVVAVTGTIGFVRPALLARRALAKPAFMDRYDRDPYARHEFIGKCTICHVGRGGDERNDFGEAFEDAGYRITPRLRARFPKLFRRASSDSDKEKPQE